MEEHDEDVLANELANGIVAHLFRAMPLHFNRWKDKADNAVALTPSSQKVLRAFLSPSFGTPEAPLHDERVHHMEGFIAEYLWFFICKEAVHADPYIYVEAPSPISTDAGGDGFVVHQDDTGTLMFRLWEIKKNTGGQEISSTVSTAYNQLEKNAFRYLARFSIIGQNLDNAEITKLCAQLTDLWDAGSPQAAAGFAVFTSENKVPRDCFTTLGTSRFSSFDNPNRLRGMLAATSDFAAFAVKVRDWVWKGL